MTNFYNGSILDDKNIRDISYDNLQIILCFTITIGFTYINIIAVWHFNIVFKL